MRADKPAQTLSIRTLFDPVLVAAVLAAPPVWWLLAPMVGTARSGELIDLIAVILLYPALEEFWFRGLLQGWLHEWLHERSEARQWPAHHISLPNLLTSLAFCAAHLPAQPASWAAAVFLPSLLFGYLRDRSGSVLPPMAMHIYYNAGLILFALTMR